MTFAMIVKSVFELALVIFTLWALFHEEQLVAFEQRIISNLRRRTLRVVRGRTTPSANRCVSGRCR